MNILLVGATGLTGSFLLKQLDSSRFVDQVTCLVRNPIDIVSEKINCIIVDFNLIDQFILESNFDVAICCLGTTIKNAGSAESFFKVDYHYVINFAKCCRSNHVSSFVLQSSVGANARSGNLYLKTKGQVEETLSNMGFDSLIVFRPSILDGDRREFRFGESIGLFVTKLFGPILLGRLKKYRVTPVSVLADKMLEWVMKCHKGVFVVENDQII